MLIRTGIFHLRHKYLNNNLHIEYNVLRHTDNYIDKCNNKNEESE